MITDINDALLYTYQWAITAPAPPPLPSDIRSNGKAKLQPAAMNKMEADAKRGRDGEMESKNPADTGAITPVLRPDESWPSQSEIRKMLTAY